MDYYKRWTALLLFPVAHQEEKITVDESVDGHGTFNQKKKWASRASAFSYNVLL